jgi:hypothetical protein
MLTTFHELHASQMKMHSAASSRNSDTTEEWIESGIPIPPFDSLSLSIIRPPAPCLCGNPSPLTLKLDESCG